jgi:DNA sulfur modification protein DndB
LESHRVKPYVDPVIEFFKTVNANDIARFRNRGSSLQSVDQNCMQMMAIIHAAKGDAFDSVEVREWVESQDAEGTKQAREMIDEINRILFRDVVDTLKAKFGAGEKEWWMKGVPPKVRMDCDKQFNESSAEHERWQYLYLISYVEIVLYSDNWELFKEYYDFYGKAKKADRVRWIVKVNRARQITHHAEKGPLSRDQVEFVRRVHTLVREHIEHRTKVVSGHVYLQDQESPLAQPDRAAIS